MRSQSPEFAPERPGEAAANDDGRGQGGSGGRQLRGVRKTAARMRRRPAAVGAWPAAETAGSRRRGRRSRRWAAALAGSGREATAALVCLRRVAAVAFAWPGPKAMATQRAGRDGKPWWWRYSCDDESGRRGRSGALRPSGVGVRSW
ncbi:hypothetical protein SEVIR_4G007801v4 [Setaria viridis]|uniref:Uncharacterized protein n=1 Tax=Setaria viridis TaxID=4556 RepID=A0A4U6UU30_SETVI|nr:hypothetical protein SEVIR_4G007801v2 [Setaria viridis]